MHNINAHKNYRRYERFSQQQLDLIAAAFKIERFSTGVITGAIYKHQFSQHEQLLAVADLTDLICRLEIAHILGFDSRGSRELLIYYSQAQNQQQFTAPEDKSPSPFTRKLSAQQTTLSPNGKFRRAEIKNGYPEKYTTLIESFAGEVCTGACQTILEQDRIITSQVKKLLLVEQTKLEQALGGPLSSLDFILNNTTNKFTGGGV